MAEGIDILSELIADDKIIPEGIHTAVIISVEPRVTISRGHPFWALKLKVGKKTTWTNVFAGHPFLNALMDHFKDRLIGSKIKISMKHRQYNERTYHDASFRGFM